MTINSVGCPAILRCDYGTENTSLATVQIGFRLQHNDSLAGPKSFLYGPSKSNIVSCGRGIIKGILVLCNGVYTCF